MHVPGQASQTNSHTHGLTHAQHINLHYHTQSFFLSARVSFFFNLLRVVVLVVLVLVFSFVKTRCPRRGFLKKKSSLSFLSFSFKRNKKNSPTSSILCRRLSRPTSRRFRFRSGKRREGQANPSVIHQSVRGVSICPRPRTGAVTLPTHTLRETDSLRLVRS